MWVHETIGASVYLKRVLLRNHHVRAWICLYKPVVADLDEENIFIHFIIILYILYILWWNPIIFQFPGQTSISIISDTIGITPSTPGGDAGPGRPGV